MTTPVDPSTWLMQGGIPAAKFATIGTTVKGTITDTPVVRPQTDIKTGEPLVWKNTGMVKQQMIVNIQTDLRDPEVENDDGMRSLWVKGYMQNAVRDAIRAAGVNTIDPGGVIAVTYTGDGEQTERGFQPPKLYRATYQPPAAAQTTAFLDSAADTFQAAQPAMRPPVPPVNAPTMTPPAPPLVPPATNGGTPAWALTPEQRAAVEAIGIDPGILEGKRRAAVEMGIDPNLVKP